MARINAPAKSPSTKSEKKAKLPRHLKAAASLGRYAHSIEAMETRAKAAQGAEKAAALLGDLVRDLGHAKKELEALPADFRFGRSAGGGGGARYVVGAVVNVREKHLAAFASLIDPKELVGMKVVSTNGKQFVVLTASGAKLVLPRFRLELVPQE